MLEKLQNIIKKYEALRESSMSDEALSNIKESIRINKELSSLQEKYDLSVEYTLASKQLEEAKEILENENDEDLVEMAKEQRKEATEKLNELEEKLKIALLPSDPNDDKDIFLEIRPAAGGDEAALFGAELLRMYLAYAQKR